MFETTSTATRTNGASDEQLAGGCTWAAVMGRIGEVETLLPRTTRWERLTSPNGALYETCRQLVQLRQRSAQSARFSIPWSAVDHDPCWWRRQSFEDL